MIAFPIGHAQAAPPPGVDVPSGTRVVVQVLIGFDEKRVFPAYVSGPDELIDAAIAAAREGQIAPPRMNGAPVLATQSIAITFRNP